jgi:hypothetical protein
LAERLNRLTAVSQRDNVTESLSRSYHSRLVPNRETNEAMEEVRQLRKDKTGKRYAKFSDLLSEIKAETDDEP